MSRKPKRKRKRELILYNGKKVCPICKERNFKLIKNNNGHMTYIKDYGLSPESKKSKGLFYFEHICANCNIRLIDYCNL